MRRVHADDTRVVHHLGEDDDGVLRLHDLLQVVVEVVRQRRRSRRVAEAEQAALGERAQLGTVERSGRSGRRRFAGVWRDRAARREPGVSLARFRLHGRDLAVGRIHDERAALLSIDGDQLRAAASQPRNCCSRRPRRRRHAREIPGTTCRRWSRRRQAAPCDRPRAARRFSSAGSASHISSAAALFLGQREALHAGGPLDRRHGGDIIGAGQIRMAVGRPLDVREPRRRRWPRRGRLRSARA